MKNGIAIKFSIIIVILLLLIFFFQTQTIIKKKINEDKIVHIQEMKSFSELSNEKIINTYLLYYESGFFKFKETMKEIIQLNSNLKTIQIINLEGKILFDSNELEQGKYDNTTHNEQEIIKENFEEIINHITALTPTYNEIKEENSYQIIQPYQDEWGRHDYTILFTYSFDVLEENIKKIVKSQFILSLFFLIISIVLMFIFSEIFIIKPLNTLRNGLNELVKNDFNRTFTFELHDEFDDLKNAFNSVIIDLQLSRNALKVYNETLEKKVQQRTKALEKSNKKLKELDKRKDEFISLASHELKTPLTSIKGFSQILKNEKIINNKVKRTHFFNLIDKNTDRLVTLIHDIVDSSRISLGKLKINVTETNTKKIILDIKENMQITIKEKGLRSTFNVEKNIPKILADKERTMQVIRNIITNAIKFTEKGSIIIQAKKQGKEVIFTITDTGKGIPKNQQQFIFSKFYQVDGTYTREFGGSGLGLSICKGIINSMNGKIGFTSKEGKGTTFYFTLPISKKKKIYKRKK